jgi:NADP-dependent aldehyde dehydrogenase
MLTGKNFIGNKLSSSGNVTFQTFNPELNKKNDQIFYEASNGEIEESVDLAKNAFEDYKKTSPNERSKFLNSIADEILSISDELLEVYCAETGLPAGRSRGELKRTVGQLRSFADLVLDGSWVEASIDTAIPEREPIPKPDLRKMMMPLGPVVVFGASNFPLAYSTAGGDTASALAAGCPVIVKSHPMHAGTGEIVASAIISAAKKNNMPNGVFSNLNSKDISVGVQLVNHPNVKAVGFTGSLKGGRSIYDLASKRDIPIPVFAEMGSTNPIIIMPAKIKNDYEDLAVKFAKSITVGSGQFCTNPGMIISIKGTELNRFIECLSLELKKIEPTCMLHPNILDAYNSNANQTISNKDVDIFYQSDLNNKENYPKHILATVDSNIFIKNMNLHHEVFGPFSLIIKCNDMNDLRKVIFSIQGQLTGTIIGEKDEIYQNKDLIDLLGSRVGRIIFDGVPTGVEVCPSMLHGGPYPATTDSRFTAVGTNSIQRWVRPFSFQDFPDELLPDELKNNNPLNIKRTINGVII